MNVNAVRQAMADALAHPAMQVNAYAHSQPTPPGVQILPPSVVYDRTLGRGHDDWTFVIQGFVSGSDRGSQRLLDELIDTQGTFSVKNRLEADKTLGGLVEDMRVVAQSPARMVEMPGGNPMLLVEWSVLIYGRGAS
jgi:hypothetical protein